MRKVIALVSVVGVTCVLVVWARSSRHRDAQSVPILEEVLRYELDQFVDKAQEPAGTAVCVGIAGGRLVVDPPQVLSSG